MEEESDSVRETLIREVVKWPIPGPSTGKETFTQHASGLERTELQPYFHQLAVYYQDKGGKNLKLFISTAKCKEWIFYKIIQNKTKKYAEIKKQTFSETAY